jgi:hypothetical protein
MLPCSKSARQGGYANFADNVAVPRHASRRNIHRIAVRIAKKAAISPYRGIGYDFVDMLMRKPL